MPKVNVYLPDDLAAAVRQASIPISTVCQRALEVALRQATALHEGVPRVTTSVDATGELPAGIRLPQRATARLVRALDLARDAARDRGHNALGTEHLLLGMIEEGENLGVRVITSMDVLVADLRTELEAVIDQHWTDGPPGDPQVTAAAARALELMSKEASQLRHSYLGCEHLLLGLIREPDGLAGQVLRTMGLDLAVTRRSVLTALTGFVHARANAPAPSATPPDLAATLTDISERLARLEAKLAQP